MAIESAMEAAMAADEARGSSDGQEAMEESHKCQRALKRG